MRSVSKRGFPEAGLSCLGTFGLICLGMGAMVGLARAQPAPAGRAAKAEPVSKGEPASPPEAAGKDQATPKDGPAPQAKPGAKRKPNKRIRDPRVVAKKKRRTGPKFEMDPNAKWVCEHPIVDLGNVWSGQRKLTFRFDIHNGGTAELRIRAQGG